MNNHWFTEQHSYQHIIDASPSGMILVTEGGEIVLANKMVEVIFGYPREELISKSVECLVPARFRAHHPWQRAEFHQNPQIRKMGMGRDLYGLKKDGTEVPVEIGLNSIELSEGKFVLAGIIDISQRKAKEVQLRTLFEELSLSSEKLKKENKENEEMVRKLDELTMIDPLTGAYNRRGLQRVLSREVALITRYGTSLLAVLLDLDNFKQINDTYGYGAGDAVLKEIVKNLHRSLRSVDYVARIGGDEFIILLTQAKLDEGFRIAEKVRVAIAETQCVLDDLVVRATASLGLVQVTNECSSVDDLIRKCQDVLKRSKISGKNKVSYSGPHGDVTQGDMR